MNQPTTNIRIYTEKPVSLKVKDKVYHIDYEGKINIDRTKDTLFINAESDSSKKKIKLIPKNSFYYYCNVFTYGFGFIWDSKNIKKFDYQKNVYLVFNSVKNPHERFRPGQKGQFNLMFAVPYINSFHLQPLKEPLKVNTGFWGLSAVMDYYYRKNHFVNISISAATDIFVTVPAAVDIRGEFERLGSTYISLTKHHRINRFYIGYGLNYSNNVWNLSNTEPETPQSRTVVKKSSQSIGLTLNSYMQLSKHFYLGLIYRPTFLKTSPVHKIEYEHLISVDFAWKWKIKK